MKLNRHLKTFENWKLLDESSAHESSELKFKSTKKKKTADIEIWKSNCEKKFCLDPALHLRLIIDVEGCGIFCIVNIIRCWFWSFEKAFDEKVLIQSFKPKKGSKIHKRRFAIRLRLANNLLAVRTTKLKTLWNYSEKAFYINMKIKF